jgi:hypothetical protein
LRGDGAGSIRSYVTDDSPRFKVLASRFVGHEIDAPTWVSPDLLYGVLPPKPDLRKAI